MRNTTSFDINTPLGCMVAVADEKRLFSLTFSKTAQKPTLSEKPAVISQLEEELDLYFKGILKDFTTPLAFLGTSFQASVWDALKTIPYGKTWSYADLALNLNRPNSFRAVANANGANPFAIIVPCHRVINKNGNLGGYAYGLEIKKWLLQHELNFSGNI